MKFTIAVIPGDGIGPEVIRQGVRVLRRIGELYGHDFSTIELQAGGSAIDSGQPPLPENTLAVCRTADAVLMGAVGGPRWDGLPWPKRPEAALYGLRAGLRVYANLRPVRLSPSLADLCPLRSDIRDKGIDLLIVRELTGGIFFGKRGRLPDGSGAFDTETYTIPEIERLLRTAYELARLRRHKVTMADKASALETSRLWREAAARIAAEYRDVQTEFLYVDTCAAELIKQPARFDVLATTNLFGDILSGEAGMFAASIGMLASASVGEGRPGLFEPIHGSAPDLAGRNVANPLATILSAAMMMRHSLDLPEEGAAIERAVESTLEQGYRTADIHCPGTILTGTEEMGERVAAALSTTGRSAE